MGILPQFPINVFQTPPHIFLSLKTMDWFTWLSKSSLEPSLVYEYGIAFTHNELEEEDISYFNHEFLQSMGISIAKHRLEILKLARKQKGLNPNPISRLYIAIKRAKRCLSKYFGNLMNCEERALVLVTRPSHSSARWKRKKQMAMGKKGNLLLTYGSPLMGVENHGDHSFSSSMVCDLSKDEKLEDDDDDDGYWSNGVDIKWDTMFQDLKPT